MLLSEIDTQIALLEMSGTRAQADVERLNKLISVRCKMNHRLKIEVRHFGFLSENRKPFLVNRRPFINRVK